MTTACIPSTDSAIDWRRVASEFGFQEGLTYLNTGSEGSMPVSLQGVLSEAMARWASSPSQSFFDNPRLDSKQTANRIRMAAFVGADPADIVITDNTTMGLGMVLLGLPFKAGDEIVTTSQDHFSMFSPLSILAKRIGVKIVEVALPDPPDSTLEIVELFAAAITARTRAFCFSHITYGIGLRMPVASLCALARTHNILTLIDGAHALGMLQLQLSDIGCDFYAASGHKWMNGPPGTGILYIRHAQANRWGLEPIISERAMDIGPGLSIADALQARANMNGPAFYTLSRTADFIETIGKDAIERRILALSGLVEARARDLWGEGCLFSPPGDAEGGALSSGIKAFVPSRNYALAYDSAVMQDIATTLVKRHGLWVLSTAILAPAGAPGAQLNTIRISTSLYNFPDEVNRLFSVLQEVVR